MVHYLDGGLDNIWLANGYTLRQTAHGPAVAVHDIDGLTQAICLALAGKPGRLSGKEFRYLRQGGMLLSQPALGRMLGADAQSVARWEKSGRVPMWADKLMRILYSAHTNGEEPIREAIERSRATEAVNPHRILLTETRRGWKPRLVLGEPVPA